MLSSNPYNICNLLSTKSLVLDLASIQVLCRQACHTLHMGPCLMMVDDLQGNLAMKHISHPHSVFGHTSVSQMLWQITFEFGRKQTAQSSKSRQESVKVGFPNIEQNCLPTEINALPFKDLFLQTRMFTFSFLLCITTNTDRNTTVANTLHWL